MVVRTAASMLGNEQIAADTGRSAALIRGLLNPGLKVYRYTHTKTGQLRYATEDELALGSDEPEAERKLWRRGELIELEQEYVKKFFSDIFLNDLLFLAN